MNQPAQRDSEYQKCRTSRLKKPPNQTITQPFLRKQRKAARIESVFQGDYEDTRENRMKVNFVIVSLIKKENEKPVRHCCQD